MKIRARLRKGQIDISEWELESVDAFLNEAGKAIKAAASEAIAHASGYEIDAWLPAEWTNSDGIGGPPVEDPMMVYVRLPLGDHEDTGPVWQFSLVTLVDGAIELQCDDSGRVVDKNDATLLAIRDGLLALTRRIDAALLHEDEPPGDSHDSR